MKRFATWIVNLSVMLLCSQGAWAADSTMLPIERRMLFNAWTFLPQASYYATNWTHTGTPPASFPTYRRDLLFGTNHVHMSVSGNVTNIWKLTACRTGTSAGLGNFITPKAYVVPALPTNWQASLQNTLDAMIETPYYQEGIGTVYFESINVSPTDPTEITVEIATNMIEYVCLGGLPTNVMYESEGPNGACVYSNNWQTLSVFTNNAAFSNDFTRYQKTLNYRQAARLRVRRTGTIAAGYGSNLDNAFTAIDNICISYPPSDVVIRKTEAVFQPGYPSVSTNITIRCYVDNLGTDSYEQTTYLERTVMVYYRWRYLEQSSNAWANLPMTYVVGTGDGQGNGERYEVALPAQSQIGDLEYYFMCDFDGYRYKHVDYTQTGYTYLTEGLSPKTLRGGASQPDGREFYARLRPFASRFGAVSVVTDQHAEPIAMTLMGDDLWRGMVSLKNGAITNLSWYFKGEDAYMEGSDVLSTNPVCWAEQSQASGGLVPYGGQCVETNASSRIRVSVDSGGYVQMIFNTRTLEYVASRSEYQNFNAWSAPPNTFTESSDQSVKQCFLNTFDAWSTNVTETKKESFVGLPSTTNVYSYESFNTLNGGWLAGSAAYAVERILADSDNSPSGVPGFRNVALRLKGGPSGLGLGYIHNMAQSRPDGLGQISFKCRLGCPASNYDIAYYRQGFTNSNYLVRANAMAYAGVSPEAPSFSLIGYYLDAENFYEYRVTQIPDKDSLSRDKRLAHRLFKWKVGVPYLLSQSNPTFDATLTSSTQIELRLYSTGTSTVIRCKFGTYDNLLAYTDSGTIVGPAIKGGSFGLLSEECRSGFSTVAVQPTTTNAVAIGNTTIVLENSPNYSSQILNWYTPNGHFEGREDISPKGIYSVIPVQKLAVYLEPSDRDSAADPSAPGSSVWQKLTEVTVDGFAYTQKVVAVNRWQAQNVLLQVVGGVADVAVDELRVSSWRGLESSDSGEAATGEWMATEAWTVTNSTGLGNVVQLDHSRGDPAVDQTVRSPFIPTGLGVLEFDYRVFRAPAKLTVQYALQRDPSAWINVSSFSTNAASGWMHATAYLGRDAAGSFRILNERDGAHSNALVEIDNAVVWDNVGVDNIAWKAYNAKITDTDRMRVALDESKVCFLNNSRTLETSPLQDQSDPFVQSPKLPAGLGELTFQARAYSNGQPATVYVYASTNGWNAASNLWFEIARFDNISNTLYRSYSYKPYGVDGAAYDAIRLMNTTSAGARRVCLEEIAVSEPVFPSFDLVNVKVLCSENDGTYSANRFQPLVTDDVGVEAQLANTLLSPSNIQMYATYYIGTNVWGVDNWPAGQTVTKPMYPTVENPRVYRTSPSNDIPAQAADQVVQYRVWATYLGGIPLLRKQVTFQKPTWYDPLDLNQTYADQGWSPYYLVYWTQTATQTTPVPVPYAWLNLYPSLVDKRAGDYEAAAWLDLDGDGHKTWEEYVAGTVPTNCESVFKTLITVSNGVPLVTWNPDLGAARVYTVEGISRLTDGVWGTTNASSLFFRAKVQMP